MTASIEQKVVELIETAQKLGEPALNVTLDALRYAAVIDVVCNLIFLFLLYRLIRFILSRPAKQLDEWADSIIVVLAAIFISTGLAVCVVISMISLFSASTWLAIFAPAMQLARQVLL